MPTPASLANAALNSVVLGTAANDFISDVQARALQKALSLSPARKLLEEGAFRFIALGGKLVKGYFVWTEPQVTTVVGSRALTGPGQSSFTFMMNPDSISRSTSPTWAEHSVPGQHRPVYQFVNGGQQTLSFKLEFFYAERNRTHIRDQIDTLRSLAEPRGLRGSAGQYDGPPVVSFFFGDYIRGETFIVRSLTERAFDLFDPLSLLPMRASVDIELMAIDPDSGTVPNRVRR